MKIKITQCSKGSYWYADAIGHIYEVKQDVGDSYIVIKCPLTTYYVLKKDCKEIVATIYLWIDGFWIYEDEYNELEDGWKSDDYVIVDIAEGEDVEKEVLQILTVV